MTDEASTQYSPWTPGDHGDAVDRAVLATRLAVFPLLGLDPHDPRD
jgi:acetoin utilization protein AcuC